MSFDRLLPVPPKTAESTLLHFETPGGVEHDDDFVFINSSIEIYSDQQLV